MFRIDARIVALRASTTGSMSTVFVGLGSLGGSSSVPVLVEIATKNE